MLSLAERKVSIRQLVLRVYDHVKRFVDDGILVCELVEVLAIDEVKADRADGFVFEKKNRSRGSFQSCLPAKDFVHLSLVRILDGVGRHGRGGLFPEPRASLQAL